MKTFRLLALGLLLLAGSALGQEPKPDPLLPKRPTGYIPLTPERSRQMHAEAFKRHGHRMALRVANASPPSKFDCREMGWCLLIMGDQGSCGSCYLYSTIEQLTEALIKAGYGKNDGSFMIATQYGMDCIDVGGCGGGNGTEVIDIVRKRGFPASKYIVNGQAVSDYPDYEARSRQCRLKSGAKMWLPPEITWGYITGDQSNRKPTIDEFKVAMSTHGVLNVSLDANGTFSNAGKATVRLRGTNVDHEITAVAYDDNGDGPGKGKITLRNQWGPEYGDGGYLYVTYDSLPYLYDIFWVSATPVGPPVPVPPALPPYKLYEGTMAAPKQVGAPDGYPTKPEAEVAAQQIATADQAAVMIHDSTGSMIETVNPVAPPEPPVPPSPPGPGFHPLRKIVQFLRSHLPHPLRRLRR